MDLVVAAASVVDDVRITESPTAHTKSGQKRFGHKPRRGADIIARGKRSSASPLVPDT